MGIASRCDSDVTVDHHDEKIVRELHLLEDHGAMFLGSVSCVVV